MYCEHKDGKALVVFPRGSSDVTGAWITAVIVFFGMLLVDIVYGDEVARYIPSDVFGIPKRLFVNLMTLVLYLLYLVLSLMGFTMGMRGRGACIAMAFYEVRITADKSGIHLQRKWLLRKWQRFIKSRDIIDITRSYGTLIVTKKSMKQVRCPMAVEDLSDAAEVVKVLKQVVL